jgi:flagellar brake protein
MVSTGDTFDMNSGAQPSIWTYDDDALNQCELTYSLEKQVLLEKLCQESMELTLFFAELAEPIQTTILSVPPEAKRLVVDSTKSEIPRKPEVGTAVRMFGNQKGIQLIIDATFEGEADQNLGPVLFLGGPPRIFRLQRREFFRFATSILTGPQLRIAQPPPGVSESNAIRAIDISRGGLALEVPHNIEIKINDVWSNCTLALPAFGEVEVSLKLRSITSLILADGSKRVRIGCQYLNLHDVYGQMIEKYVLRMQRDQVAKERGWGRNEPITAFTTIRKIGNR